MEPYITIPVAEELESLRKYLAIQSTELHVSIDSPIPIERYIIPGSFILIVQYAQRYNLYPLYISIRFLAYSVEVSFPLQPRPIPDVTFSDIDALVTLYRNYFNLPTVQQTDDHCIVGIPLFI